MAAATATLSPFSSMIRANSKLCDTSSGTLPIGYVRLQRRHVVAAKSGDIIKMSSFSRKLKRGNLIRASVTEQQQEEATQISTPQEEEDKEKIVEEEVAAVSPSDNPVSVSVSPSDLLTMFFQAEGTMTETAVPTVTNALEEIEGISNLKIQLLEGIASVELTKQTTVQATGVASSLVEIIQGSGFKLQTLNLSFEDEEDIN